MHRIPAFPCIALLLAAADPASSQPHPADEVFMVWNNGGRVSIEVYKANDGRTYERYSGGGYQLGGVGGNPPPAFLSGDFDGDRRSDVLHLWNNAGRVSIEGYAWNTSARRFSYTLGGGRRYGGYSGKFLSGDVNGDKRADIIQIWNNGGFVSIEGYTFNPATNQYDYSIGGGAKFGAFDLSEFFAGDVDGDERTDILHLRQDNSVYPGGRALQVYRGGPEGFINSTAKTHYPNTGESQFTYRVTGDLNRDRLVDLFKFTNGEQDGYTSYLSNGATLNPSDYPFFTTQFMNYAYQLVAADVDGDGDSDMVGPDWYYHNHDGRLRLNVYPNYFAESGSTTYWQSGDLGGSGYLALLRGNVE